MLPSQMPKGAWREPETIQEQLRENGTALACSAADRIDRDQQRIKKLEPKECVWVIQGPAKKDRESRLFKTCSGLRYSMLTNFCPNCGGKVTEASES